VPEGIQQAHHADGITPFSSLPLPTIVLQNGRAANAAGIEALPARPRQAADLARVDGRLSAIVGPDVLSLRLSSAMGAGFAGDVVCEVLPEMARKVKDWWGAGRAPEARRAEVEALAGASPEEVRKQLEQCRRWCQGCIDPRCTLRRPAAAAVAACAGKRPIDLVRTNDPINLQRIDCFSRVSDWLTAFLQSPRPSHVQIPDPYRADACIPAGG